VEGNDLDALVGKDGLIVEIEDGRRFSGFLQRSVGRRWLFAVDGDLSRPEKP
jgi:hypothetical protein